MIVSKINIYPIKSLKGISLSESSVEKRGLRYDRRWMLTDKDGIFFTQREVPKMATVTVAADFSGLTVTADGFPAMRIPAEPDRGERQAVIVWQSTVSGEVYLGEISEWFSEVLERRCQLVRMPETSERHVNSRFDTGKDIVSFADGYPLLLIGEASLADLNERIARRANASDEEAPTPLPMNRFRPNVVVQGSEPFEEDQWSTIRIGETIFRVVKPCARCVITTVDQNTGEFNGKEPLRTLASYRKAKDVFPKSYESLGHDPMEVLFGENLIPKNPGSTLRIGDRVTVIENR
jgi:uncharacterized protein